MVRPHGLIDAQHTPELVEPDQIESLPHAEGMDAAAGLQPEAIDQGLVALRWRVREGPPTDQTLQHRVRTEHTQLICTKWGASLGLMVGVRWAHGWGALGSSDGACWAHSHCPSL